MQGRQVERKNIELENFHQLDVSFLKEGMYVLTLQNGSTQVTKMIMKKP